MRCNRLRRLKDQLLPFAVAGALALAAAGCDDEDRAEVPAPPPPGQTAQLRIVHAAADAPAVDVYAAGNAEPIARGLMYGDATMYLTVPAGTVTVEIRPAGAPSTVAPILVTDPIALEANARHTAVAAGRAGSNQPGDRLRVVALRDGFASPAAGTARVRILHAGPDAGAVNVDVGNDGTVELMGLARFDATAREGIELPSGMPLRLGVTTAESASTVFTTPALADGATALVIASGFTARPARVADGFSLLAVFPEAPTFIRQDPLVVTLHAGADAPPIDVFVEAGEIVDNLSFGQVSSVRVSPGTYRLDVFPGAAGPSPRPAGDPVLSASIGPLDAGQSYLVLAAGELATGTLTLQSFREGFDLDDVGAARVRFVHGVAGAPVIDAGVSEGGMLVGMPAVRALAFPQATPEPGTSLPPGPVTLGVAATGTTLALAEFPLVLTAGQRAFAVVAGSLMPAQGMCPLRLLLVDTTMSPWAASTVMMSCPD